MSESASATNTSVAAAAQLEYGKTHLLFQNAGIAQAVSVLNASVFLFILGDPSGHPWALGWWLAVVAVAVSRYLLARRFQAIDNGYFLEVEGWRRLALLGTLVAALVWGGGIMAFMLAGDTAGRLLSALVMAGMIAGAVPVLSAVPAAFRVYAVPTMLCVIGVAALNHRGPTDTLLLVVSVIFLLAMLRSSRYFHDALDHALRAEIAMRGVAEGLEQARKAAEMASSAKSQFLSNMSHELRTPLNGVLGLADILSLTKLDVEQSDYLGSLQKEGQRLHRMIEDVLELAKLDSDEVVMHEAPFLLDESLTLGLRPFVAAATDKGLKWELTFQPGMHMARSGDSSRLMQAVVKLVDNAVKFTERGMIKVGAGEAAEGMIVIEIADTGVGMTPAQCQAVLTDFTQVDSSSTRRHEGLGIGLTLARRIVKLLRGRLEIESKPGQGTTVRLIVPLPSA